MVTIPIKVTRPRLTSESDIKMMVPCCDPTTLARCITTRSRHRVHQTLEVNQIDTDGNRTTVDIDEVGSAWI
eukprot:COSAG02_NODE_1638_length_11542_cov_13.473739_9_plen_72_part_00